MSCHVMSKHVACCCSVLVFSRLAYLHAANYDAVWQDILDVGSCSDPPNPIPHAYRALRICLIGGREPNNDFITRHTGPDPGPDCEL